MNKGREQYSSNSNSREDIQKLHETIHKLEIGIEELLNSQRWKIGNLIGDIYQKLLFRKKSSLPTDYINSVLESYKKSFFPQQRKAPALKNDGLHSVKSVIPEAPVEEGYGKTVDIIVCIHDALEDVKRCLDSIFSKTFGIKYSLILVNDHSSNETTLYLRGIKEKYDNVKLIENNGVLGYTKSANIGLSHSHADYAVLLNSDTIVTRGWLQKIIRCGESNSKIGIIGPLSNAASFQSVPKRKNSDGTWAVNELPEGFSADDIALLIDEISNRNYPFIPVLNGFCFAIKREVIDRIGYFDENAFPLGYGEENDYCFRASREGYFCAVADDAYVYHAKSKSFGHDTRGQLSKQGWERLKEKYGSKFLKEVLDQAEAEPILATIGIKLKEKIRQFTNVKEESNIYRSSKVIEGNIQNIPEGFLHVLIICPNNSEVESINQTIDSIRQNEINIKITILAQEHKLTYLENECGIYKMHLFSDEKYHELVRDIVEKLEEEYFILLYAGDKLLPDSLNRLYAYVKGEKGELPGAVIFDDCSMALNSNRKNNYRLGFSPDLLLEYDYIENSVIFNTKAVQLVGGLDESLGHFMLRDMLLRLWESGKKVRKLDCICIEKVYINNISNEMNYKFIRHTLVRRGVDFEYIQLIGRENKFAYKTNNKVASIIIPFKDQISVTKQCVDSIIANTDYEHFEIILVDNNSSEPETHLYMQELKDNPLVRIISYKEPFNYSKINNYASQFARGGILVFLNNDTEVISSDWLRLLVGDAQQHGVGAVGACLYYPDGTIQHAGVVIGLKGLAGHLFAGEADTSIDKIWLKYRRNVSAVTGACMAIQANVFHNVGGFDEQFEVTGSDVELCLRLMERGYRNIINPQVRLFHHEKKTRKNIPVKEIDIELSLIHYQPYLDGGDPYFNSNYSHNSSSLKEAVVGEIADHIKFRERYKEKKKAKSEGEKRLSFSFSSSRLKFDNEVLYYDVTPQELMDNTLIMAKFKKDPNLKLDTVLWFIPNFDHVYRGGIFTIFRFAEYLTKKNLTKNLFVVYNGKSLDEDKKKKQIGRAFPKLKYELIFHTSKNDINSLPESDAAICTLWNSAYLLVKYNKCRAKFYFNQDFEPIFYPAGSVSGLIEQTYRFGFIGIANTKGVADYYRKYNKWVYEFVPGVDTNIFYPDKQKTPKKGPLRIVFYGRPNNARNGFRLAIESLRLVKKLYGNKVQIISVGGEYSLEDYDLQGVIENWGVLSNIDEVAELYRTCHIGLVFMFTPHPSYQPLEYMASGCATVTNINENNLWLLQDHVNCLLTEPTVSCVANRIIELIENEDLRNRIVRGGLETVTKYNWEDTLSGIYNFMKHPLGGSKFE
jgi:GT2 family glycosyltransferase